MMSEGKVIFRTKNEKISLNVYLLLTEREVTNVDLCYRIEETPLSNSIQFKEIEWNFYASEIVFILW